MHGRKSNVCVGHKMGKIGSKVQALMLTGLGKCPTKASNLLMVSIEKIRVQNL